MKQIFYTALVLLISSQVFAGVPANNKKREAVKVMKAQQKFCLKNNQAKNKKRPVPKISISNPKAMKEI
jgi:hypothetical protein